MCSIHSYVRRCGAQESKARDEQDFGGSRGKNGEPVRRGQSTGLGGNRGGNRIAQWGFVERSRPVASASEPNRARHFPSRLVAVAAVRSLDRAERVLRLPAFRRWNGVRTACCARIWRAWHDRGAGRRFG